MNTFAKSYLIVPGALILTLLTTACATQPPLPQVVESSTDCDFRPTLARQQQTTLRRQKEGDTSIPQSISEKFHVNVLDRSISNKVQVHELQKRSNPLGTTRVSAVIVNCTDFPLWVQGRTHFTSQSNTESETSAWKSIHLAGRSQEIYEENSISDQRIDVRVVEIRELQ